MATTLSPESLGTLTSTLRCPAVGIYTWNSLVTGAMTSAIAMYSSRDVMLSFVSIAVSLTMYELPDARFKNLSTPEYETAPDRMSSACLIARRV